ncbi:MAG: FtsB family cell division protein [Alphaproteobacteria bacterium]
MYFLYHAFQGHRSYPKLMSLQASIEQKSDEYASLKIERDMLERRVKMLRPGSIQPDFLEERVRLVLGYKAPEEIVILEH